MMLFSKKKKRPKKRPKTMLGKVWYFIWEEDSIESWIVNFILAFILIKFLVYPGIGLALGTSHPIVAVVSGSMEHKTVWNERLGDYRLCGEGFDEKHKVGIDFFWEACGGWYEARGITKAEFDDFPLSNGFNTGDLIILRGKDPDAIEVGEVIVFFASKDYPIIHRVVDKRVENGRVYFTTKGDHNEGSGLGIDMNIPQERVIGVGVLRVPALGWIKIGAFKLVNPIIGLFR